MLQAAGVSKIKDLSSIIGVSSSNISMWKKREVPEGEAYRISHLLGCPASWLLTGEGQMKSRPYPEEGTEAAWIGTAEGAAPEFNGVGTISADEITLLRVYRALTAEEKNTVLLTASAILAGRPPA
jgi:hypothetical protein